MKYGKIGHFSGFWVLGFCVFNLSTMAMADTCTQPLPQVTLQLTAEQWVTTQTAKIVVALDASLTKEQLSVAQENINQALKKISPEGEWHITEFNRNASKANLEQLHVVAEARLPNKALPGLRDRANKLSHEGQIYTIEEITYNPTIPEISTTYNQLRMQIYRQAKEELARLNDTFSQPTYTLYSINFAGLITLSAPVYKTNTMSISHNNQAPVTSMAVSKPLTLEASVVFAAPLGALCVASK